MHERSNMEEAKMTSTNLTSHGPSESTSGRKSIAICFHLLLLPWLLKHPPDPVSIFMTTLETSMKMRGSDGKSMNGEISPP